MIEYTDGTFGDIETQESILDKLQDEMLQACVRSVHFGSVAELDAIKTESSLKEQMAHLSDRLAELEVTKLPSRIHKPSLNEVEFFTKKAEQ